MKLQRLAAPLTMAQLAFAVNTFVTNWFLAHSSTTALHAALPGSMLAVALSSLAISSLGYAGTIFARRHKDGDSAGARAIFHAALILTAAAIPVFILALPLGHLILAIFNTTREVFAAESAYFDILLVNGFFTTLAAVLGGYFTGQGKTRLVGAITILGFLVNMALAPVLINGLWGLPVSGIPGAGWAATIAHIVPCLLLGGLIWNKERKSPVAGAPGTDSTRSGVASSTRRLHEIQCLLRLGLPNGMRAVIDIGGFFVFVALLAECAPAAAAASTAAFAVNGVFQAFPKGLGEALEILTARRESQALSASVWLAAAYTVLFALLLLVAGEGLLLHFWKGKAAPALSLFLETARPLLWILIVKSLFESLVTILQAHLRGNGQTAAVFRIQFFSSLLFWTPLYLGVRFWHPTIPAYWLTMVACSFLSTALLYWRARSTTCPPFRRTGRSLP